MGRDAERQKVTRKIAQTKRTLGAPDLGKKERRALEKTLFELRVDLNYIMVRFPLPPRRRRARVADCGVWQHYPKMEKYVSLFPPAARGKGVDEATAHEQEKTDKRREEVRAEVRAAMEEGRLSGEPEAESRAKGVVHADKGKRAVLGDGESARATKKARGEGTMGKSIEKVGKAAPAGDEFFEAASDVDEGNEPPAGEGTGEGDDSGEDDDDESKMDDRE